MTAALGVAVLAGLVLAGVVVAGVALLRRGFALVTVYGESMLPTYRPGDRLVVRRGRAAVQGEVVVFAVVGQSGLMVKRVAAVAGEPVPADFRPTVSEELVPAGRLLVLGDNPTSLDSRLLGYIDADTMVGVVTRQLGAPSPVP